MRRIDLSLYLVADTHVCGPAGVEAVVRAALAGGITAVQLRDKTADREALTSMASRLKALLLPAGVPLIVNDDAAAAVGAGADGVHVGQKDGPPAAIRAAIGPDRILGLSVEAPEHVSQLAPGAADYLGAGPVRATATKPGHAPPIGLDGLAAIASASPVPVVAIGGIGPREAEEAMRRGAAGVAVVSAICAAGDPEEAARAIRAAVERGRRARNR